jgi:hypothetical protein
VLYVLLCAQTLVPLLCVAMQPDATHSSSLLGAGGAGTGIVRQAALTTLVRIALALNYRSGRQLLRWVSLLQPLADAPNNLFMSRVNLDYIVDDVCCSLRYVRRLSDHRSRTGRARGSEGGMGGVYDDKIIRVVGAVFAELDLSGEDSSTGVGVDAVERDGLEEEEMSMVIKDMVTEALEAIDCLCAVATATSHSGGDTGSSWRQGHVCY